MSVILANGGDQTKRRELDYYPTPPDVTHALMRFLKLPDYILAWEPACGKGVMSEVIKTYITDVHSTDIEDHGYGVESDFLKTEYDCDAIITNPPFNLSEGFIKHALKQAPIVAMVLKSQYWHAKKRFDLFNDHPPAWVLPLTWRPDFLFDQRENGVKGSPTMEVHWTVWIAGDTKTKYKPLIKPNF